jgi:hypothetical protein
VATSAPLAAAPFRAPSAAFPPLAAALARVVFLELSGAALVRIARPGGPELESIQKILCRRSAVGIAHDWNSTCRIPA